MRTRAALMLSICALVAALAAPGAQAFEPHSFAIQSFAASLSTNQAGAHPDFTTSFELARDPATGNTFATTREIEISLPPGLLGDPSAAPRCTAAALATTAAGNPSNETGCSQDAQVGVSEVTLFNNGSTAFLEPVYNMVPSGPGAVARLGFFAFNFPIFIDLEARPERDYAVTARIQGIGSVEPLLAATTTIWGVPASATHDAQRLTPYEAIHGGAPATPTGTRPSGLTPVPFLDNPTRCGVPLEVGLSANSYAEPRREVHASAPLGQVSGCEKLPFKPSVSIRPTSSAAESPSGVDAAISLPQDGLLAPGVLATAHLKKAIVTLPVGAGLNPAAATGIQGCGEAQVGLTSTNPPRFDGRPAECPAASQVGTAEITTPVLARPLKGRLYLANQFDNPFHTLLAGYLVAEGQGLTLKVAGRFDLDSTTGQITATFAENPQAPFEELTLHFKEGARGVLVTPPSCGAYTTLTALSSWAAANPEAPTAAETASAAPAFLIRSGPRGGPCPTGSFQPRLVAGTVNPVAAFYSPFLFDLSREDGTQRIGTLSATLPEGLLGNLVGIPYCSDATLASIPTAEGAAAGQLASPSCPAASQIGTVSAGAGAGPSPFYLETGRAYLAGPYANAPLSMAIVAPVVAGPFDLGNVVVRVALYVSPETAQITAVSDPLPRILGGIPLDIKDIRVDLDRDRFTLNPTSCDPTVISAVVGGLGGALARPTSRFQVGGCGGLAFKPRLKLRLKGATGRTGHPALKAVVTFPKKGVETNIRRAQVNLPHGEFLDQGNIDKACTRPVLLAGNCPKRSIYGYARAWTPLLAKPLQGPVYLVGGYGYKLPALVADLNGQVRVTLVGKVDSGKNKGIRNTFDVVPDAPVSRFVLSMKGGKRYGLLENSENLCKTKKAKRRAIVRFVGQNGEVKHFKPVVTNECKKHGSTRKRKSHGGQRAHWRSQSSRP